MEIIVRTQAESPSIEIIRDDVSYKLVLDKNHDIKIKGERDAEFAMEINKSYHRFYGTGLNKNKFLRAMKKDLEARFGKKEDEVEEDEES